MDGNQSKPSNAIDFSIEKSDEDKIDTTPFPLEDGTTSCLTRGLFAGAFGIPIAMFISLTQTLPEFTEKKPVSTKASVWGLGTSWRRVKDSFKLTFRRGWVSGKNFFWLGLAWSGAECVIESARGKTDMWNPTISAVATGVALSWRGGIGASMVSAAIMTGLAVGGEYVFGKATHRPSNRFLEGM